ncbi:Hypothetical predicted protein [Lecanosticta acicola]|uniref:Uncharacterized protein n=1 Tax=Lecanosticta acicola TaxID=111012 RepID=A0AAI8YY49_9PEZI|nr:Hypothetical predicted protein [Lecanosticta acicola]
MLSALLQQQSSAAYNPSPQAFYGPVGGGFPASSSSSSPSPKQHSHHNSQSHQHQQQHQHAFPAQHVDAAAHYSQPHRSAGGSDGVRSPSAASGGNVMQQYQPPSANGTPYAGSGSGSGSSSVIAAGPQYHFPSAPYTHPVPAQAPSLAHQFVGQQQHHHDPRPSASPQLHLSPHAGQPHQREQQPTPPSKYPMAAPPLPHTPTSQPQSATSNNALASPQSPQSPGSQNREQQRINILFEINVTLLQEVNKLQAEGHGGAISPQQAMQLRSEGKPDKMASEEYIQCLRRVQANLSYLAPKASADASGGAAKPRPAGPAHMTPPPHMPHLLPKYEQLKELFPGWQGFDQRPPQSSSPGPNSANGMTAAPAQAQA